MTETATANNPNDASASEASATLLTTASTEANTTEQTQTTQTQATQSTEAKADGTQTTEATTETKTEGAPEKYDFKAPEETVFDSEVLDAFTGAAKKANLTQDAAQKLLETMGPAITARQADQVQAIHKEWHDASTADKEFGGEKLAANLGVARKAVETFGTPELSKLLTETGLGNHPEVIRFMYRAGKAISEDTFVGGRGNAKGTVDPASVLYDNTKAAI